MKRYYKHIAVVTVLLLLFAGMLTNCMLNNIKDTDSILHDDYKYLSLVDGAIAWETGVVRRLYDLGQIFPVYKQDKAGRKLIENYQNVDQSSKLVRLIHAFFYRVPGSTGQADFGATVQLASDDPIATVKLIADIMVQCDQLQQQRIQFYGAIEYVQGLVQLIVEADWLSKVDKKTTQAGLEKIIQDAQQKPWNRNVGELFISTCKLIAKNLAQELGEHVLQQLNGHRKIAEKFFTLISASTQNLKKIFKPVVFKSKESIDSFIFEALNESDPNNPDALYPAHTVEMILLAFVYKKYSYNRNVLKAFYDALNMQLDGKVLVHELTEAWVKDSFAPVTQDQALSTIENIFAAQDLMQSIKKHFAEFVYNALQIRSFPAPVGYAKATYEYEKGKKTPGFADCMDNSMRNFINLYAYDAMQNTFTFKRLLATMGLPTAHPALADFLKTFDSVNVAPSQAAHDAWSQVISNIPYCNYRGMVNGITEHATRSEEGKGYMVIPENEKGNKLLFDWLKKDGYQVIANNQYGYELRASVKNIIIVLDHLLQLNLFTGAGGLAKEFMRPDFIKEYFPKLCTAIHATGFLSTQPNATQGELDKDFDALDYTDTKVYMTIRLADITCEFTTYAGHGELTLLTTQESIDFARLFLPINNFSGQPSLSLLVTNLICQNQITFGHLENNPEYLYINLFVVPLENTDKLKDLIYATFDLARQISMKGKNNLLLKTKLAIKDFLLDLVEKQPDDNVRQEIKLYILKLFVSSLDDADLLSGAAYLERSFQEAIQAAVKGIINQNQFIRDGAYGLFNALFVKNQGFVQAIDVAQKGIVNKYYGVKLTALRLFIFLVNNDKAFDEAMLAATSEIDSENNHVSDQASQLFKALIDKDKNAFDKVVELAEKMVRGDASLGSIYSGLSLLYILLSKDLEKTKEVVERLLNDPNLVLSEDTKKSLGKILTMIKRLEQIRGKK